jgi:hypothetical protein
VRTDDDATTGVADTEASRENQSAAIFAPKGARVQP